jgi:hypothetical protein
MDRERALLPLHRERLFAGIALIQALGGDWSASGASPASP